ncbi:hypothetical protein ROZALSC1DRAFT_28542 [Rozella allomycis CSF55]|uniref:RNI-like protein n=1 Tax=Rozella allomycis (strain CSF55) TaxID=988480 RepID=A0A4P9YKC6_ROZAC|nr:hypothetical protein ROZALSC1DRAFT_28542 [Rozella allomycis CSF55]
MKNIFVAQILILLSIFVNATFKKLSLVKDKVGEYSRPLVKGPPKVIVKNNSVLDKKENTKSVNVKLDVKTMIEKEQVSQQNHNQQSVLDKDINNPGNREWFSIMNGQELLTTLRSKKDYVEYLKSYEKLFACTGHKILVTDAGNFQNSFHFLIQYRDLNQECMDKLTLNEKHHLKSFIILLQFEKLDDITNKYSDITWASFTATSAEFIKHPKAGMIQFLYLGLSEPRNLKESSWTYFRNEIDQLKDAVSSDLFTELKGVSIIDHNDYMVDSLVWHLLNSNIEVLHITAKTLRCYSHVDPNFIQSSLKHFKITKTKINDSCLQVLGHYFDGVTKLSLENVSFQSLASNFKFFELLNKLDYLSYSNTQGKVEEIEALYEFLKRSPVKYLRVSGIPRDLLTPDLLLNAQLLKEIQFLEVSSTSISDVNFAKIGAILNASKLTHLTMRNIPEISESGIRLFSLCLDNLVYLDMAFSELKDTATRILLGGLATSDIQYLNLYDTKFTLKSINNLTPLMKTLYHLNIGQNAIKVTGLERIAEKLKDSNISELNISFTESTKSGITTSYRGMSLLTKNMQKIKILNIENNLIAYRKVIEDIIKKPKLQVLNCRYVGLPRETIAKMRRSKLNLIY